MCSYTAHSHIGTHLKSRTFFFVLFCFFRFPFFASCYIAHFLSTTVLATTARLHFSTRRSSRFFFSICIYPWILLPNCLSIFFDLTPSPLSQSLHITVIASNTNFTIRSRSCATTTIQPFNCRYIRVLVLSCSSQQSFTRYVLFLM